MEAYVQLQPNQNNPLMLFYQRQYNFWRLLQGHSKCKSLAQIFFPYINLFGWKSEARTINCFFPYRLTVISAVSLRIFKHTHFHCQPLCNYPIKRFFREWTFQLPVLVATPSFWNKFIGWVFRDSRMRTLHDVVPILSWSSRIDQYCLHYFNSTQPHLFTSWSTGKKTSTKENRDIVSTKFAQNLCLEHQPNSESCSNHSLQSFAVDLFLLHLASIKIDFSRMRFLVCQ